MYVSVRIILTFAQLQFGAFRAIGLGPFGQPLDVASPLAPAVSNLISYCVATCTLTGVTDVDHNPSAFSNAYWEVNSIRVYTPV